MFLLSTIIVHHAGQTLYPETVAETRDALKQWANVNYGVGFDEWADEDETGLVRATRTNGIHGSTIYSISVIELTLPQVKTEPVAGADYFEGYPDEA